jgi:DNA-directed RNA polymerase specialized sigma24 family protein
MSRTIVTRSDVEQFFREEECLLLAYARKRSVGSDGARDAVQHAGWKCALYAAQGRLHVLEGASAREAVRRFALTAIRNRAFDERRRAARLVSLDADGSRALGAAVSDENVERRADARLRIERLGPRLLRLSPGQRRAIARAIEAGSDEAAPLTPAERQLLSRARACLAEAA